MLCQVFCFVWMTDWKIRAFPSLRKAKSPLCGENEKKDHLKTSLSDAHLKLPCLAVNVHPLICMYNRCVNSKQMRGQLFLAVSLMKTRLVKMLPPLPHPPLTRTANDLWYFCQSGTRMPISCSLIKQLIPSIHQRPMVTKPTQQQQQLRHL